MTICFVCGKKIDLSGHQLIAGVRVHKVCEGSARRFFHPPNVGKFREGHTPSARNPDEL